VRATRNVAPARRPGVRAPAVTSVGPAVTPSSHLPRRPPKPRAAPGFTLLSPLPSAKPVDTRRPSPPRELDAVHAGREKSTAPSNHRITTAVTYSCRAPPELGPRAPTRASGLAATRCAAMRRRRGRRGFVTPVFPKKTK
jgi:hypothetical protein